MSESQNRNGAALAFLSELWPEKPDDAYLQLWHASTKKTHHFNDLAAAAAYAADQGAHHDVYLAVGAVSGERATKKPIARRAASNNVAAIPGLWADIDIKPGACQTIEQAAEIAGLLVEPTLLVSSGSGLHAWWLFDEPWYFDSGHQRIAAANISAGYQAALRLAASEHGVALDSTHDLARLMRLPGTRNHKQDDRRPLVEQLDHDGARHDSSVFASIAVEHTQRYGTPARALANGESVEIEISDDWPSAKIAELCSLDRDFARIWGHDPQLSRTQGWTASEFDMSIATRLSSYGFTDQEIAGALRHHRRSHYPGDDKQNRPDYLRKTIGKARSEPRRIEAERQRVVEFEQAVEQIDDVARAEQPDTERIVSLFNKTFGGPPVKALLQNGTDGVNKEQALALEDGRIIPLGTTENVIEQKRFERAWMAATGDVLDRLKHSDWTKIIRALLKTRVLQDPEDETRTGKLLGWLEMYCRDVGTDRDGACEVNDSFTEAGMLYVSASGFMQYLNRRLSMRDLTSRDLKLMMERAVFRRVPVRYEPARGGAHPKQYMVAPLTAVLPQHAIALPDPPTNGNGNGHHPLASNGHHDHQQEGLIP